MEKNKRNGIKHLMALMLFFMVLSVGTVSLADVKGTVIAKSAVIRASADPNSAKLASVPSGKVIDIISKTSGTDNNTWYQVYVNSDTKGFIRSDLIKVPDGADIPNTQGGAATTPSADTTPTTATPVDAKQVSVLSNNTNIRESASTNSASKAKANRGMILTVVGEADGSDGKKWYQVTFTYNNEEKSGYVRSDLVTTDNVPNDPATSQITGEVPGEEQPPAETPPAEEPPAAEPPVETPQPENNSVIPMNVDEVPYIMPGFELSTLSADGQGYNAYK
ncbi:MAG: SH3 domain-containing protein, partial [Lachnospiraceae bacterium]|nr:SH3 domain-containing protein [Lachnospiraceae bacterium]